VERALAACHRGQEDDRRVLAKRRVEAFQRPDVFVVDVDVHEGRELGSVPQHLPSEAGEPLGQVGEEVAQRRTGRLDLARAADRVAQRGWNADPRHQVTCVLPPWQNST
jgi:hypothetical protein